VFANQSSVICHQFSVVPTVSDAPFRRWEIAATVISFNELTADD
jgi:hypothetical protein